jgi:hypothetical protein
MSAAHRFVLGLALALALSPACAQVTINPSTPKQFDTVHVQVAEGAIGSPAVDYRVDGALLNTYNPRATQVTMTGNKVTVSVVLSSNGSGSPSASMDLPIGQLPAGFYQLEVVRRLPDGTPAGTVGTSPFVVGTRAANDPLWNASDLWWNAAESGWGLALIQHGAVLFGALYVYGADNKPTWYVVPGGTWNTPTQFRGSIYRTTGPYFGGTFDPNAVNVVPAGEAVITLNDSDSNAASVSFTIDGTSFVKSIRRQPF